MRNLSEKLASSFALAAATFSLSSMVEKVNAATMVDLELGLIIDASGSIGSDDFELQLDAYQSIFSDANFYQQFIEPGDKKQIAVSAFLFADDVRQDIGWTLIDSQNASTNFGKAFENITRDGIGGLTNTGGAISTAANSIVSNNFDADQQSLDISTDGFPTVSPPNSSLNPRDAAAEASNNALSNGVDAINAIGVGSSIDEAYLRDFIIGGKNGSGSNAFVLTASDFDEFTTTLETKIQREVVTPPDPDPVTPTPPVDPDPVTPTPPVDPDPVTPTPPVDPNTGAVPEPSIMLGILAAGVMRQRLAKHLKRQKK
jgi:hypothetical protein